MKPVATVKTAYREKFGIPRQSGLVASARGILVFEPEYRNPDVIRALEGFSHIWLIWLFSGNAGQGWHPTVRPPRLGGNKRVGVFASRSPFRPNPIGLSAVRLEGIENDPKLGPVLHLGGVDLMDGTPILDIKPYIPYSDSIPDARSGFAPEAPGKRLQVRLPEELAAGLTDEEMDLIRETLALDPRPSYQEDAGRVYGMAIGRYNARFTIDGDNLNIIALES